MKIGFLLGSPDINGGTYVIYEHASRLIRFGHRVAVITEQPISSERFAWHPEAKTLQWMTLEEAGKKAFDIVIATWWQSVFLLEKLLGANYFYFIQSVESRFFPNENEEDLETRDIDVLRQWCESTYRYPLPVITEAKWISRYLAEHYNRESFIIPNGIRKDLYRQDGKALEPRRKGRLRVLIEGPVDVYFKNVKKTIELCNNSNVDEIWLLTSSDISHYDGVDRCFSKVPINKTPEIYRSCDVLVKLSYVEGMFGPPLEMFHCGGTALVYDVTGYDEYIEQNKNSLVVKKDSEKDVIHHLNRMKNEPGLIERLQQGALETASEWPDWSEATLNLEKLLKKYTPQFDAIPSFLSSHSEYFMKNRENAFCAREISRLAEREHITAVHDKPFLNFVQVYYHCGEGFSNEKMRWQKYHSGDWVMCKVSLPCYADTMQIRVDPSVRVGIVQIRSLKVRDAKTGRKISEWRPHQSWDNIEIGGTAAILRKKPYPVLNCYGEDPQLILPTVKNNSDINVEIELREMSYSQALCRFSDLCENKKKMGIFQNLKYKLLGKN